MRLQEIHDLAEKGLHLWARTKDPLTLSACVILLKASSSALTQPQQSARDMLALQLDAYTTLYTEPLQPAI